MLLKLLPKHVQGQLLAYEQSGRLTKEQNRSVSFAAITFYDPARPPAESIPKPVQLPPLEQPAAQPSPAPPPPVQEEAEQP